MKIHQVFVNFHFVIYYIKQDKQTNIKLKFKWIKIIYNPTHNILQLNFWKSILKIQMFMLFVILILENHQIKELRNINLRHSLFQKIVINL